MNTDELDSFFIRADQILTMPPNPAALRTYDPDNLVSRDDEIVGLIRDGGIWVEDGLIRWVGSLKDAPDEVEEVAQLELGVVTPGLIDCHTHAVFAGDRHQEFVLRNAGRAYIEILEAGGGILQTVESVRKTSRKALAQDLVSRCYEAIRRGVTTIEVKSGYGLSVDDEVKQLRAIRDAAQDLPCELVACFLGAHAIPKELRQDRRAYIELVKGPMLDRVVEEGLATYIDVFCDRGAFTADEAREILFAGKEQGLIPRIHAEEITQADGAKVAAEVGATSADHLEFVTDENIAAMYEAGVTAVLMPAVNLYLGTLDTLPPARKMLNAGLEIAIATDYNPGSAMTFDLTLCASLGCMLYKITPGEALRAITRGAACALGRDDIGHITAGARADLTGFDLSDFRQIPYRMAHHDVAVVISQGRFSYWTEISPMDE